MIVLKPQKTFQLILLIARVKMKCDRRHRNKSLPDEIFTTLRTQSFSPQFFPHTNPPPSQPHYSTPILPFTTPVVCKSNEEIFVTLSTLVLLFLADIYSSPPSSNYSTSLSDGVVTPISSINDSIKSDGKDAA